MQNDQLFSRNAQENQRNPIDKMTSQEPQSSQQNPDASQRSDNQNKPKPFTKKNWDAILAEFDEEESKEQNVDALFKQIYQNGSDEVRRAMNKSYMESGGTVLSTNWDNVAHSKVEPKPPRAHDDDPTETNPIP